MTRVRERETASRLLETSPLSILYLRFIELFAFFMPVTGAEQAARLLDPALPSNELIAGA